MMISELLLAPRRHETEIRRIFKDAVSYTAEPIFDTPLVLLAFTNRSGSNLLAEYLCSTDRLAGFAESFNSDEVERAKADFASTSFPSHVERLYRALSQRGALPGFKVSPDQLLLLYRWNIVGMFNGVRVVHMMRRDAVAQAVSLVIADQTKQWASYLPKLHEPTYDRVRIKVCLESIASENMLFSYLCALFSIPYMSLYYESLTDDPASVVGCVSQFAGVDIGEWRPVTPGLEKQASQINREFSQRFLAEERHRLLATTPV